jgi:uncharacterized protein YggE
MVVSFTCHFLKNELFMNKTMLLTVVAAFVSLSDSMTAVAQVADSGAPHGIVVSATESVALKPERLRLTMWIKAQGNDAKSAIVALAAHKERVAKELESLKADKESLVFSSTRVTEGGGDANQRRMMQMQMRAMSGGRSSEKAEMPTLVTATCAVRADWPLPVQEGDALAMLPAALKEQIAARDLVGEKNKPKLSDAEQEKMEEISAMMEESYSFYEEGSSKGPAIVFLATVNDETTKSATEAAFKKALKKAEMMSDATGLKLGKLLGVTATTGNVSPEEYYSGGYGVKQATPEALRDKGTPLVSDEFADQLTLSATVVVTYAIE